MKPGRCLGRGLGVGATIHYYEKLAQAHGAAGRTWNGSPRAMTYISPVQLTAQILASDLASAGVADVRVSNPAPCGGDLEGKPFAITSSTNRN